jgi:hypothetical protein
MTIKVTEMRGAVYSLPTRLAREIGRFITTWAYFEHFIQALVWNCLNLSAEAGRIAIREPRLTDRIDMILDLADSENILLDEILLLSIKKAAAPLATWRHLMAHGLWMKDGPHYHVLLTRGTWDRLQEEIPNYPKGKKSKYPQGILITPEIVRSWREETESILEQIKKVGDNETKIPEPSPQKPRTRSAPANPTRDRAAKKPKPPPQSSRE